MIGEDAFALKGRFAGQEARRSGLSFRRRKLSCNGPQLYGWIVV